MPVVVCNGDADFDRKFSAANNKAVFVDFTASWCGPCQRIAPVFSDLANQYKGSVFLKVDVDECRGTASTYGVNAMPTFFAFVNGQKMATIQGADENGLRSMVSKYGSTSSAFSGTGQMFPFYKWCLDKWIYRKPPPRFDFSKDERLSSTPAPNNFQSASSAPPPRPANAPPVGPNPLEPLLNIIQSINERGNGLGIPDMNAGGFLIQPFHILLGLVLLFLFGPFGALIALAICFFTQPRGAAPGARPSASGSGPRPPQNQGPRPFGGSGQRLGGN